MDPYQAVVSGIQLQDLSDEKSEGDFASSVSSCKPEVGPVETSVEAKRGCFDVGASTAGTKREFRPVEVRELNVKQQLEKELSAYGRRKEEFEFLWTRLISLGLVAAGSSRFKLMERSLDVADYERGLVSSKYEEAMKKHVDLVKNGRLEIENLIFNFKNEIKKAEKKLEQDKKKLEQDKEKLEQEKKKKLKQGKKKK
ncbi:unnamed protein product [Arabidopsis lyrata]|uniref:uncharacterized protein LOC110226084 n=1 Tax=Arabidopsis lyrata subsp. lyrata TaxID=81972 RepID=UPI000A29D332|nr:uncharacterized protein LOC110226084 [Arabidopsis lyrata subsp. lyrata]CAH8277760.1 unnamed protein product [Arabidopsis lyrata]|eukprot:XP_020872324.1 uncharacterized protein LOC110226084 [Arabidopsis lyrata subsp. lyrata]